MIDVFAKKGVSSVVEEEAVDTHPAPLEDVDQLWAGATLSCLLLEIRDRTLQFYFTTHDFVLLHPSPLEGVDVLWAGAIIGCLLLETET